MTTSARMLPRTRGVLAALVLVALTAGLPYLLWAIAGSPIPSSLPSWAQAWQALSTPDVTGELTLAVLGYMAWFCWAAWVISLGTELLARLRGRPLPSLGPQQQLASKLVSAVLVAFTLAPGLAATASAAPAAAPVSAPAADSSVAADAESHLNPTDRGDAERRFTNYRVVEGDTLWDIATARLGDPWRWPEIFRASRNIKQPDGDRLQDPDLIEPGWRLRVPASPEAGPANKQTTKSAAKESRTARESSMDKAPAFDLPDVVTPLTGANAGESAADVPLLTPLSQTVRQDEADDSLVIGTPFGATPEHPKEPADGEEEAEMRWRTQVSASNSQHRFDWRELLDQPFRG